MIRQLEWHFSNFFRQHELTYEKSVAPLLLEKEKLHQRVLQFEQNDNLNLISDFTANKRIETFQFLLKVTLLFEQSSFYWFRLC